MTASASRTPSGSGAPEADCPEPDCPDVAAVPFSFELFPPRSEQAAAAVRETVRMLAAAQPQYISVTYGANGTSRDTSIELLRYILEHTDVHPLAHLTCVGNSHAEASKVIREFLEAGVTSFLALRGDPPADAPAGEVVLGDLHSASELVQLIHRVQAERMPYTEEGVPGLPGATRVKDGRRRLEVAVAAFPNGHPRSKASFHDVDALLAKQVAGAEFAIHDGRQRSPFGHGVEAHRVLARGQLPAPLVQGAGVDAAAPELRRRARHGGGEFGVVERGQQPCRLGIGARRRTVGRVELLPGAIPVPAPERRHLPRGQSGS